MPEIATLLPELAMTGIRDCHTPAGVRNDIVFGSQ